MTDLGTAPLIAALGSVIMAFTGGGTVMDSHSRDAGGCRPGSWSSYSPEAKSGFCGVVLHLFKKLQTRGQDGRGLHIDLALEQSNPQRIRHLLNHIFAMMAWSGA